MYTYYELPELVQRPNYPRPSWGTEIFHQLPNISSSIIISTSVDSDGLGLHVIGKSAEVLSSCSRSNIQPCAYAGRPNSQAKSWHFILLKKKTNWWNPNWGRITRMALDQVEQLTHYSSLGIQGYHLFDFWCLFYTFLLAHLNPTWTCRCASLSKASSEAQSLAKAVVFPVLEFPFVPSTVVLGISNYQ